MAVIIPFQKPKQEQTPAWRQDLMKRFWDEKHWCVFPDGSKRLALTPGRYVSVVTMPVGIIYDDSVEGELWWSFSLHGGEHLDDVWRERADAEQAAWEALLRVEEKRMLKREKQRR